MTLARGLSDAAIGVAAAGQCATVSFGVDDPVGSGAAERPEEEL